MKSSSLFYRLRHRQQKAEIRIGHERMEAKIEATRRKFQTQLKEVEARVESRRGTGTGVAKPLSSTELHHGPCSGASSRR
jgi:hypothetical protein